MNKKRKLKKIIIITIICFCSFFTVKAENSPQNKIENLAINFLNNLQTKNISKIKNLLSDKIQLKIFDDKKKSELVDDMMMEKISVFEYILRITGHNLQQFLNDNFKLTRFSKAQDYGMEQNVNDKNITGNLYYIKFKISYENCRNNKKIDRLIEIDIIKENDKFKIFGFVI